ncbi:MAG: hypothetical protein L6Q35_04005 [Phycisphaerales bacterium]|nr:hypothetical protein [Phycisphaerales bacterium]
MPTYEYRCNNCSHEFEAFQSMKDRPLRACPECGKKTLERLIGTGAAIVFKGSGFYQTDYRSESYRKAAEADSKAAKPGEKPDAKTDAKADAKPSDTKAGESKAQETTPSPAVAKKPEPVEKASSSPRVRVPAKPAKRSRK